LVLVSVLVEEDVSFVAVEGSALGLSEDEVAPASALLADFLALRRESVA
jgi:hypothetical protein